MFTHHKCRWLSRCIVILVLPPVFGGCSSDGGGPPAATGSAPNATPSTPEGAAPSANVEPGPRTPATNDLAVPREPPSTAESDAESESVVTPVGRDDSGGATSPTESAVPPPTAVARPSGPCPDAAILAPGDTTKTLTVDGIERTFLVHVPPGYDGTTRMPVVFDFHGLGTQNTLQKQISRWDDVGDAQGFITVYPQGVGNSWNAGGCCGDSQEQQVDDVGFVRAIIENLTDEACIDARRVYSSGCSNGGAMSYRLACEAADVIAAVAPVDFDCVVGGQCSDCAPVRPITEVQFRGTNDQLVPYEGNGGFFLGAQGNLATWGEINECSGEQAPLSGLDGCESFSTCSEGAQTVLCTVEGGTHCGSYGSFQIAEKAWTILQDVVLP